MTRAELDRLIEEEAQPFIEAQKAELLEIKEFYSLKKQHVNGDYLKPSIVLPLSPNPSEIGSWSFYWVDLQRRKSKPMSLRKLTAVSKTKGATHVKIMDAMEFRDSIH